MKFLELPNKQHLVSELKKFYKKDFMELLEYTKEIIFDKYHYTIPEAIIQGQSIQAIKYDIFLNFFTELFLNEEFRKDS